MRIERRGLMVGVLLASLQPLAIPRRFFHTSAFLPEPARTGERYYSASMHASSSLKAMRHSGLRAGASGQGPRLVRAYQPAPSSQGRRKAVLVQANLFARVGRLIKSVTEQAGAPQPSHAKIHAGTATQHAPRSPPPQSLRRKIQRGCWILWCRRCRTI